MIQVGLTDPEQYVHRLGRTARAGKEGSGTLLLSPFEVGAMEPVLRGKDVARFECAVSPSAEALWAQCRSAVARDGELTKSACQCYAAWLGFHNGKLRALRWDKPTLVRWANEYSAVIGLTHVPALQRKTVGKMGLKGTPGLVLE